MVKPHYKHGSDSLICLYGQLNKSVYRPNGQYLNRFIISRCNCNLVKGKSRL